MSGRWTIEHADGDILVDGHLGDYPEPARGETVTFEWVVYPRPNAAQSQQTAYDRLVAFEPDAGRYAALTAEQGRVLFIERLPSSPRVSTLVVQIDPSSGVAQAPTLWGLVDRVSDETNRLGDRARIDMDVLVLSDVGEHATVSDLRSDLERS